MRRRSPRRSRTRSCPRSSYTVESWDSPFADGDIVESNYGGIEPGGVSFQIYSATHDFQTGFGLSAGLRIDTPFALGAAGSGAVPLVIGRADEPDAEHDWSGVSTSGQLVFTACELTTRSVPLGWWSDPHAPQEGGDFSARFVFVQVEGYFSAVVEGYDFTTDPPTDDQATVEGDFSTAFSVIGIDAATAEHLETECIGGRSYSPPSP